MGEKVIGGIEPLTATGFDGATEMQRVPVDDDGGEQVAGGGIEPVRDPAFGRGGSANSDSLMSGFCA